MTSLNITSGMLEPQLKAIQKHLNTVSQGGEQVLKQYTAEDTGRLQEAIYRDEASIEGFKVSVELGIDENSDTNDYATYVYDGVPSGQERKYYKNGGRKKGGSPFMESDNGTQGVTKTVNYMNDNL